MLAKVVEGPRDVTGPVAFWFTQWVRVECPRCKKLRVLDSNGYPEGGTISTFCPPCNFGFQVKIVWNGPVGLGYKREKKGEK